MPRSKPEVPEIVISNLDEVDQAMLEVGKCRREIGRITSTLASEMDAAKDRAAAKAAPVAARLKTLEKAIAIYATSNKKTLFTKKRSRDLLFGTIGFRKSTSLKGMPKVTLATVLENVKRLRRKHDGIRIKEELDKEAMLKWDDKQLEKVGARRVESDTFYIDLDSDAIEEKAGATT